MMRDFQRSRPAFMSTRAACATSHPAATAIACNVLRRGGNAADAAISAAAALCVLEPQQTGIGGDCFVLYKPAASDAVFALDGAGPAPLAARGDALRAQGMTSIPAHCAHAVTVPGAVRAWAVLHRRYGKLPFSTLLEPAIELAEQGYPVLPRVAYDWAASEEALREEPTAACLLVDGRAPRAGQRLRYPGLAATLRCLAENGPDSFYTGRIAADLVTFLRARGGTHTLADFAAYQPQVVDPLRFKFEDYEILELPPSTQGFAALLIFAICAEFEPPESPSDPEFVARFSRACAIAYGLRDTVLADARSMRVDVREYLTPRAVANFADQVASQHDRQAASPGSQPPSEARGDTVYLCVVDPEGNAISFINSLFDDFGSTLVAPDSQILLHSRGSGFSLAEGHPNCVEGGKRPLHTLIPGLVLKHGRAVCPFGVMGGQYQAAGHGQFLSSVLRSGMDVQSAIDAPRHFLWNGRVALERGVPPHVAGELQARGFETEWSRRPLGGAQAIWIGDEGLMHAGSDPRKDGCAFGF
jgi:gamma-glutamyltranspeptidase / glutathione hydrolase